MNYNHNKTIESLIDEVSEKGIVSKAQLYQDLKRLTDNFSEIAIRLINDDVNNLIKNLEYKYKPLDWKKPFTVVAPKEYNNQMSLIKKQLSNLQEFSQLISEANKENIFTPSQIKASNEIARTRPIFKTDIIDQFFRLLKDHFDINQQEELKAILQTGKTPSSKLYFKGNGNRLADAFKSLIDSDFITGCQKQELQKWIFENFQYRGKNNQPTRYTLRYLEDIISTNKDSCRKPILEVKKENGYYKVTKA